MSSTVKLKAGVVDFDVNVAEFCAVVRNFVGVSLDAGARQALKAMIEEVDKDFELVVEVLIPLYAINTVDDFRTQWPGILQRFKTHYLTNWGMLTTHCGIVMDQLDRVRKAHRWKRRVPLLRGAVQNLEDMGGRWMANDQKLHEAMDAFMRAVDAALVAVNQHRGQPRRAVAELQRVLQGTEASLLKIKAYSNELKRISAQF